MISDELSHDVKSAIERRDHALWRLKEVMNQADNWQATIADAESALTSATANLQDKLNEVVEKEKWFRECVMVVEPEGQASRLAAAEVQASWEEPMPYAKTGEQD
jgi:predicted  nucleic acid-binding Zn-ribbon protein